MHILQIHTSMSGGGIQAVVCNLANELARKGENVTVCSISLPKESDVFWKKLNDNVRKVTLGNKDGGFSVSIVFKIYTFLKNSHFDVVHIHGFFCYYFLSILLLHRKVKFVYTVHSDAYMENGKWDLRLLEIKKFCFKKGWIEPITISNVSQESFKKLYGIESKIIFNGIPTPLKDDKYTSEIEQYRFTSKTLVFIHAGRIDTPKNQLVLCKVFQTLINDGHDIVLLLAGGVTSSKVLSEIRPFFSKRIVYLGVRNNIPQLMSQCDAMCLPSLWEGLPIVMLEAMSVGCIPICSPVGGIVDVIKHGDNGILSKSSSYDDYYNAIFLFLRLETKKKKDISYRAKESFMKYTVEIMANNYLKTYKE